MMIFSSWWKISILFGRKKGDIFQLEGYEYIDVSRKESLRTNSRRGHDGVGLFVKNSIKQDVEILAKHNAGFIWIKLGKCYFHLNEDICICIACIPHRDSKVLKARYRIFRDIRDGY